jgi:hypothetical protein
MLAAAAAGTAALCANVQGSQPQSNGVVLL